MLGGHVRVGLEDNLRLSATARAGSNAELVGKAVELAGLLDRTPASADEARAVLGLDPRPAAQLEVSGCTCALTATEESCMIVM